MSDPSTATGPSEGPLAIIGGGGTLPFAVADAVLRTKRPVVLFALRGFADPVRVADYRHHWIALGQYGWFRRIAEREGCREVVFIGSVVRPALSQIKFDVGTLSVLPRIVRMFRGGDNHLLSSLIRILEEDGFRVRGAHEVAPDILVPTGALGRHAPSERDRADIARGLDLIGTMGAFDVGQAVVVANNHVLAVEAIEGTDQMLTRIADLRRSGRIRIPVGAGTLVKAPKPGQERRVDLPSIGPQTIEGIVRAGLGGLAVVAGEAVVADPERLIRDADRAKVFVAGVSPPVGRAS